MAILQREPLGWQGIRSCGLSGRRPPDNLEVAFLILLTFTISAGWIAFTLAELGWFHGAVPLAGGTAAAVLVGFRLLRSRHEYAPALDLAGLAIPLVVAIGLFFPPDEWILGNADPGVYVNGGVTIARTGGIVLQTPIFAALPSAARDELLLHPVTYEAPSRLPGFYNLSYPIGGGPVTLNDRTIPWGFHLYPSILAIGYTVGGLTGELLTIPLLALTAVGGFYLFVRRLFGTAIATLAALFLVLSPAQIWFARFPAAEVLVQLLIFGGLLCFVLMVDTKSTTAALLAGVCLGEIHLAKIEYIPLVAIVGGYAFIRTVQDHADRNLVAFVSAYAALGVHASIHATAIASFYAHIHLFPYFELFATHWRLAAGAMLVTMSAAMAIIKWRRRLIEFLRHDRLDVAAQIGLPLMIGGLAAYGYYIRPFATVAGPGVAPLDDAAINNLQSFVRLGWYVTPLGLLLGTIGWMLLAIRGRSHRSSLFLAIAVFATIYFLADAQVTPMHYWAARRWLPITIPGFFLAIAYALHTLVPMRRRRLAELVTPAAFILVILAALAGADRPLIRYVEYRGATSQIATLAGQLAPDGLSLFPNGDPGLRLAMPLQIIFSREAIVYSSEATSGAKQAAESWLVQGKPVYWIATADQGDPSQIGLRGSVIGTQRISLPEKIGTHDTRPGADGLFQQDLIIWELAADPDRSQTGQRSPDTSR